MSTQLPTISVTAEKPSDDDSSSDSDSFSNDMDYNANTGDATDVEDFDSQAEIPFKSSKSTKSPRITLNLPKNQQNDVTDVEDYNDSDSDDDQRSKSYAEIKLSLQEFLQHDLQEQILVNDDSKERIELKDGNFLQAQNLNGISDYLTDCEDYDTDSEINYDEKSVCLDLNETIDEFGQVRIADETKPGRMEDDDSDEYEDVSVLSDISDAVSALSDATGAGMRGISEDELLQMSGDEIECQIAYSGSSSDDDDCQISASNSNVSLPTIDVTFIKATGKDRGNAKIPILMNSSSKRTYLEVDKKPKEEVLTDVEGLDDSAAEEDSFDNDEESQEHIPRAVILATGDDGTCQTDVEDFPYDELLCSVISEVKTVSAKVLPPPHREVIVLKEDEYGDTITNVMPMDREFQFGLLNNFKEEDHTDSEDYSCAEDFENAHSIVDISTSHHFIESDVIVSNEVFKPAISKRIELQSNTESVTDIEEIYVAGTNRRKKLKTRSLSKGKSKLLDVAKPKEAGATDVEDIELSDCGLPPTVQFTSNENQNHLTSDKVTDVEDLTTDEVSEVSEGELASVNENISNLKEYIANSANFIVSLETDGNQTKTTRLQPLKLHLPKDDASSQQHTDVEDIQMASDAEDNSSNTKDIKDSYSNNYNCNELNDMLNESYTVVHEKNSSTFNADAERLHIKGMREPRDAHTDVEYVESDESIARANN